ncbi:MAG: hypothetical protein ACHQF0_01600 [Chitinophagales bacterium]
MKFLLFIAPFILLSSPKESCNQKKRKSAALALPGCFKGKLEVKGGCMNYTIGIISKNFDTSLVMANWTDENTGKSYKNAFALNSRCTFPNTINEGDEFYFVIDSTTVPNCVVCLMYYPVPAKKLSIKIIQGPCGP